MQTPMIIRLEVLVGLQGLVLPDPSGADVEQGKPQALPYLDLPDLHAVPALHLKVTLLGSGLTIIEGNTRKHKKRGRKKDNKG